MASLFWQVKYCIFPAGYAVGGNFWMNQIKLSLKCVSLVMLALAPMAFADLVTDIPNCQLWLDADDSSSVTLDGDSVVGWADKSGNGIDFINGAGLPTYQPGQLNGRATIDFSLSSCLYSVVSPSPDTVGSGTWFVVYRIDTWNNSQTLLSKGRNSNFELMLRPYFPTQGTLNENNFSFWGNGTVAESDSWIVPIHEYTIVEFNFDGTRSSGRVQFYKTGVSAGTSDAVISPLTTDNNYLSVGGEWTGSEYAYFLAGEIAELIWYSDALGETHRNNVGYYLQQKYDISGDYVYYDPPQPRVDLIPDSFEGYVDDTALLEVWSSTAQISLEETEVYAGNQAIIAVQAGSSTMTKNMGMHFDYTSHQDIKDVVVWFKGDAGNDAGDVTLTILGSNDSIISQTTYEGGMQETDWTALKTRVELNPAQPFAWNTVSKLQIEIGAAGTMYFDDIQFKIGQYYTDPTNGVFPRAGEWPSYRRDGGLTSHSPGKASMENPLYRSLHFLGASDNFITVEQAQAGTNVSQVRDLAVSSEVITDPRFALNPDLPAGQELTNFPPGFNGHDIMANVLPGETTMQWIDFESGFELPTINGQWQPARVRCKKFNGSSWEVVWETTPFTYLFTSNAIAGDFDNDGDVEIAFLPWYKVVVLNGQTGAVEKECSFTSGRNYGYFSTYDINGNGSKEFVILSDFAKHLEVCGYDANGNIQLLWQREIEMALVNPQRQVRVNPFCIADVNNDGTLDIVVSMHNPPSSAGIGNYDDFKWHVIVYDGMSGSVLADFPDEHLAGVVDVDGSSISEVLTQSASGVGISRYGTIRVRDIEHSTVLWSMTDAAWQMYNPASKGYMGNGVPSQERALAWESTDPMTFWTRDRTEWVKWHANLSYQVHSGATLSNVNILHRMIGNAATVVICQQGDGNDQVSLSVANWNAGGFSLDATVAGRHLLAMAISDDRKLIVRHTDPDEASEIALDSAKSELLFSQERGVQSGMPVIAWDDGSTRPVVIAQGAAEEEELVAFHPAMPGGQSEELWRISGRAQGDGWPDNYGPVIADLNADGYRELIYATSDPATGCARLMVCDLNAEEVWHHDFLHIPGTAPVWNTGGIIFWRAANFNSPTQQDVLVTVRRNIMHSDETYLLSGADGHELWRRTGEPLRGRGTGGQHFAIADYDGDGLDEAASLYPDILYILDGSNGADLILRTVASLPGHPSNSSGYWGVPMGADLLNNGTTAIFHGTTRASLTGVIVPNLSSGLPYFAWADGVDVSPSCLPAIGDFDADGQLEAMSPGFADGIHCYDTATGNLEWTLPFGGNANTASADLDNDDADEAVFVSGGSVWCYDNNSYKWQVNLPCSLSAPALGDIRGSGDLSVVVVGSDGYAYAVDSQIQIPDPEDLPKVSLVATDNTASEVDLNAGEFTVYRTDLNSDQPLEIYYDVSGSATVGIDYAAISWSVTIPAGSLSTTIAIEPYDDYAFEGDETVVLAITPGAYNIYGPGQSDTVYITSDDTTHGQWVEWDNIMQITFAGYEDSWNQTLTDFPVLVVLPDEFDYSDFTDSVDGADLRFANAAGVELPYEIEEWNTSGESSIWVRVDTISGSSDYIYMYWNNPDATVPPEYRTNGQVWSNGYEAVWHYNRNVLDSTSNNNHGVDIGTTDAYGSESQIGHARYFNGSDACISMPLTATSSITNSLTISTWFKQGAYTDHSYMGLITKADSWGGNFSFMFDLTNDNTGNDLRFALSNNGSNMALIRNSNTTFDEWHHMAGVWDGVTMRLYVDGREVDSTAFSGNMFQSNVIPVVGTIYYTSSTWNKFNGFIDEMRISTQARSEVWIKASYINQNAGFLQLGEIVVRPPADIDGNGKVDFGDFAVMAREWLDYSQDCARILRGDLDGNCHVDLADLEVLTNYWIKIP